MDSFWGPRPIEVVRETTRIEDFSDLPLALSIFDEPTVNLLNHGHLFFRSRDQNHAVRLKALPFAVGEKRLRIPVLVNKKPSETVPRETSLPESKLN
jgi:hypothetical protein